MKKKLVTLAVVLAAAAVLVYAAHSLDLFVVVRKMHGG